MELEDVWKSAATAPGIDRPCREVVYCFSGINPADLAIVG